MTWKRFPHCWPFARGTHRLTMDLPIIASHKAQVIGSRTMRRVTGDLGRSDAYVTSSTDHLNLFRYCYFKPMYDESKEHERKCNTVHCNDVCCAVWLSLSKFNYSALRWHCLPLFLCRHNTKALDCMISSSELCVVCVCVCLGMGCSGESRDKSQGISCGSNLERLPKTGNKYTQVNLYRSIHKNV